MNWDYLAGLLDGEGTVSLGFMKIERRGKDDYKYLSDVYLAPVVQIYFTASHTLLQKVSEFLKSEGIETKVIDEKNNLGRSSNLQIFGWSKCKLFCLKIQGRTVDKPAHIELLSKAIELHDGLKPKFRKYNSDVLQKFDVIRHELHSYAKKGRKELKEYFSKT